jgi:hypothetical protein
MQENCGMTSPGGTGQGWWRRTTVGLAAAAVPPLQSLREQRDRYAALALAERVRADEAFRQLAEAGAALAASVLLTAGSTAGARPGPLPGTVIVGSRAEYEQVVAGGDHRREYEQRVLESLTPGHDWTAPIFCQACDAVRIVRGTWTDPTATVPNFRETLICPACGLNNRQRFTAALLETMLSDAPPGPVYLYEQVTAMYTWATGRLSRPVIGSEYLGHDVPGGAVVNGIRHEDALAMSFEDGSLAAILSTDVYEHVPDVEAALAEAARTLRPGGRLVVSIPFDTESDVTVRRAQLVGTQIEHLLPPEYHGNPVSGEGSLVFSNIGWDFLQRCREVGFEDVFGVCYWSPTLGYLGNGLQMVFIARRG